MRARSTGGYDWTDPDDLPPQGRGGSEVSGSIEDEARERAREWNRHGRYMRSIGQPMFKAPVERADIPLDDDRTAALAEALAPAMARCYGDDRETGYQYEAESKGIAKDALLYLREHGWTLEREER